MALPATFFLLHAYVPAHIAGPIRDQGGEFQPPLTGARRTFKRGGCLAWLGCCCRAVPAGITRICVPQGDIITGISGLAVTYAPFSEIIELIKVSAESVRMRVLRPLPLLRSLGAAASPPLPSGWSVVFHHAPTGVHTIAGFPSQAEAALAFDELVLRACGTRAAASTNYFRHLAGRARCATAVARVAEAHGDAAAVRAALAQVRVAARAGRLGRT